MNRLKITPKLTLVFVLFAGILMIGLTIPAYLRSRESLRIASLSEQLTTAIEKEASLNSWVYERKHSLEDIANQDHLQETLTAWMSAETNSSDALYYYTDLINDLKNWAGSENHRFFSLNIIDAENGVVIASTDPDEEGKYKDLKPYFLIGKETANVQNPIYDITLGQPVMTGAAPILSNDGKLLAVLSGSLNLQEMNQIIQRRTGLHVTDDSFLVNTSNILITQPRLLPDPAVLQRGLYSEAVELCLQRNSGSIEANDYRGIPAIIVYRWLPERQLCLITKINQEEAYAPVRTLGRFMFFIGGFLFLFGSLAAFFMSRSISKPVRELVSGTREISQGNLDYRIDVKSKDEIGDLGLAFNRMANSLKENETKLRNWTTELEQKVNERTKELFKSEERYRVLAETSPEMIFVIDKEDRVQYVNQFAAEQFGKIPEKVIGLQRSELFPPNVAEGQKQGLNKVFETAEPLSSESKIVFPGGKMWLETQLVPIQDESGSINAVMGISRDITDRKLAEQTIKDEKDLSDTIINSLPGVFYLFDSQGKFLRWNKNFESVSGFTNEEMHDKNPLDFFSGEEKALVEKRIQDTFIYGESFVEANFISKTGTATPYLLTGIRAEINGQIYLIGTGIDISERKYYEQIMHKRSNILEYAVDHSIEDTLQKTLDEVGVLVGSPIGFYHFVDADQNGLSLQAWSTLTLEEYCKSEGEGLHYPIDEAGVWVDCVRERKPIIHNDYACLPNRKGLPAGHAELNRELVVPIFRKDLIVAILGVGNKPGDYTDRDVDLVTFFADLAWTIVESKQAEEKIRSINERFELAKDSAQLGVWDWDVVNNILIWDDQMYVQYGVKKEGFSGAYEAWVAGLHPDDVAVSNENVQMALRGEKEFDTQFRIVWPDGTIRFIKASAQVLRNITGEPTRMIGINYDITELIEAQEKLNKANQDLARSNAELERFAYVASHDLQEPLRMVTSYLQLLVRRYKDRLDGDAIEFINYAVDGSNRMKILINDLLAYSRVGSRSKEFKPTNCETVINNVLKTLELSIKENKVQVTHDSLPEIFADEGQIEQVFQNLVANALKFRGENPPKIHIGVKKVRNDWVFSVSDNGIGIDPQFFDRIFIIFQRLHSREDYEGTGIGLAICKRIVERHGGRIWIESEQGKGTIFYFSIPKKGDI